MRGILTISLSTLGFSVPQCLIWRQSLKSDRFNKHSLHPGDSKMIDWNIMSGSGVIGKLQKLFIKVITLHLQSVAFRHFITVEDFCFFIMQNYMASALSLHLLCLKPADRQCTSLKSHFYAENNRKIRPSVLKNKEFASALTTRQGE